ncbi:short-chain oxidoreductase [Paramyrothecium foliicola]|nr:short-chain oxidoreductase [Paramyrothecium foliicola]
MATAGDNVVATGRNADTKLAHLQQTGVTILDLDVTAPVPVIEAKIQEAWHAYPGGIDVVVNNAGFILSGAVEELTNHNLLLQWRLQQAFNGKADAFLTAEANRQEDMEASLKTNFHGPLNITRAILPKLRARASGTLLYISSQAGWHADPSAAAYCSAKFALEGAVECLAKELAIFCPAIKVLIVEPGYFKTKAFSNINHVEPRVADYAQFNAGVRQFEASIVGNEPGDADKAVARMIELVKGTGVAKDKKVPLRVPLGTDGWSRIKEKCEEMLKICDDWEDVAKSTDLVAETA